MTNRLIFANILNIADAMLTLLILHLGYGVEGNPIMAQLLTKPYLFVFVKIFTMLAVSLWIGRKEDKYSNIASCIAAIFMVVVVVWNAAVLIGMNVFYNDLTA